MLYESTLKFLYSQLPMFQRVGIFAYRADLMKTKLILEELGNPHKGLKTIHIAGTNGKGSTSHTLAAILQTNGYKTGLYTSPHLVDFRERIKVNGKPVGKMYVCDWVKRNRKALKKIHPSFFEMTVGLAFEYFKEQEVDIAVIETGLGGRLDSTNVIYPEVSVITNIGFDHTDILGETLVEIANEKAGIIKRWAPVVISETHPETEKLFKEIAEKRGCKIYFADQNFKIKNLHQPYSAEGYLNFNVFKDDQPFLRLIELDLNGNYQTKNILGVLQTIDVLREKGYIIKDDKIKKALSNVKKLTGLMGRWDILDNAPLTICDVAHNAEGIHEVLNQVKLTPHERLHFVFGMVKDKDITKVLKILPKDAAYYFCNADLPRALEAKDLMDQASKYHLKGEVYPSVNDALKAAQKAAEDSDDLVLISGSTFVVAEALVNYL
jgi:dihydrofolate synthase/folylpolyglutamate synthase